MNNITININFMDHFAGDITKFNSETLESSGIDLCASEDIRVPMYRPGAKDICTRVHTGVKFALPRGYEGQIRSCSGLALNNGVIVFDAPVTVDSNYRDEIDILLINFSGSSYQIRKGDKVAQLVIVPIVACADITFNYVRKLVDSDRDEGGFGATG